MEILNKLYLVPTPIGNFDDITLRALEVLKGVDLILAEDTRDSARLMRHFEIATPMQSYHLFNEHKTVGKWVTALQSGRSIALISDAGTPGISDPGFLLVRACVEADVSVECLPGACAMIPALVASGLPCDRFHFEGFLPHKKGRQTRLNSLSQETQTLVLYESPHRLVKTLEQMLPFFGNDRMAAVCRELSKLHEEVRRGSLLSLKEHYQANDPKGEIVLVVSGLTRTQGSDSSLEDPRSES